MTHHLKLLYGVEQNINYFMRTEVMLGNIVNLINVRLETNIMGNVVIVNFLEINIIIGGNVIGMQNYLPHLNKCVVVY